MNAREIEAASSRLELFNEKAAKLERSRFFRRMLRKGVTYRVRFGHQRRTRAKHDAPNGEVVDAFVLTYRWFVQDSDGVSIRRIARLYKRLPVSRELRKDITAARWAIRRLLSQKTQITVKGHTPTRREVCETFLYGDLAHANPAKRARMVDWKRGPVTLMMLDAEFVATLARIASIVVFIRDTNRRSLDELGGALATT